MVQILGPIIKSVSFSCFSSIISINNYNHPLPAENLLFELCFCGGNRMGYTTSVLSLTLEVGHESSRQIDRKEASDIRGGSMTVGISLGWIKRLLGDEGTAQLGDPADIQFRIVSIDRGGSRLAIPAVSRRGYSSETEGLSGTTVPSPMRALCSINSVNRKDRNGLPIRQFKIAFLIAIGVNRKKRGCVLGIIPNRAAPFIQIETNDAKGYTIEDCYPVLSGFQSRSDSSLYLVLLQGGFERPLGVPTQFFILNKTQKYVNTFFHPQI